MIRYIGLTAAASLLAALAPSNDSAGPVNKVPLSDGIPTVLHWYDFDADGLQDVFAVVPGAAGKLLRNTGSETFEDVTERAGLGGLSTVVSAGWHDYDLDGRVDLLITDKDKHLLLFRQTDQGFVDWTETAAIASDLSVDEFGWTDTNGDGRADLHLTTSKGHVLLLSMADGTFERIELGFPKLSATGVALGTYAGAEGDASAAGADDSSGGIAGTGLNGAGTAFSDKVPNAPRVSGGLSTNGDRGGRESLGGSVGAAGGATVICAPRVRDAATGSCVQASSDPTIGMLYPLGNEFYISDVTGNVGVNTTLPTHTLTVNSADDDALRLIGAGEFGSEARLNFGDSDFVYLYEDVDDHLQIHGVNGISLTKMNGGFGLGTLNPTADLHLSGGTGSVEFLIEADTDNVSETDHPVLRFSQDGGAVGSRVGYWDGSNSIRLINDYTPNGEAPATIELKTNGQVFMNGGGTGLSECTLKAENPQTTGDAIGMFVRTNSPDSSATLVVSANGGGDIIRGFSSGGPRFRVTNTGRTITTALQITGGGDLVEGFDSSEEIEPGSVVAIDPENPGQLMMSSEPYDTKVAGAVSGAGGIDHGIQMGQDGVLDGDTLIAMTGRVYVKCSAENGPIRAGDRLTSSSLAGHAMRVTDNARSVGAVIGKAMTALESGQGLVLVLVNLQ